MANTSKNMINSKQKSKSISSSNFDDFELTQKSLAIHNILLNNKRNSISCASSSISTATSNDINDTALNYIGNELANMKLNTPILTQENEQLWTHIESLKIKLAQKDQQIAAQKAQIIRLRDFNAEHAQRSVEQKKLIKAKDKKIEELMARLSSLGQSVDTEDSKSECDEEEDFPSMNISELHWIMNGFPANNEISTNERSMARMSSMSISSHPDHGLNGDGVSVLAHSDSESQGMLYGRDTEDSLSLGVIQTDFV